MSETMNFEVGQVFTDFNDNTHTITKIVEHEGLSAVFMRGNGPDYGENSIYRRDYIVETDVLSWGIEAGHLISKSDEDEG